MSVVKRLVAALPDSLQFELETHWRAWQLRTGRFTTAEPEFARLAELVRPGEWVVDVGANIGHYTVRLAELVGPEGRVVALEPVARTFSQLAAVVVRAGLGNVTLLNAAASDRTSLASMAVPVNEDGLRSYYDAHLAPPAEGERVLTVALDDLPLHPRIALVKLDVEGHEVPALRGMMGLIRRCRPALVVEDSGPGIAELLHGLGYRDEKAPGSPNRLFLPVDPAAAVTPPSDPSAR